MSSLHFSIVSRGEGGLSTVHSYAALRLYLGVGESNLKSSSSTATSYGSTQASPNRGGAVALKSDFRLFNLFHIFQCTLLHQYLRYSLSNTPTLCLKAYTTSWC